MNTFLQTTIINFSLFAVYMTMMWLFFRISYTAMRERSLMKVNLGYKANVQHTNAFNPGVANTAAKSSSSIL